MLSQVVLLLTTSADWKGYIDYMRQSLDEIDEKACFSRVGRPYKNDYAVMFEDSQRVQNIQEQLLRTMVVLNAHLEVVSGCKMHCRILGVRSQRCPSQDLVAELDDHSSELRIHRSAVNATLERSQGTLNLVGQLFKILELRNDESFTRKAAALHEDIEQLRDTAHMTRRENEAITKLAEQNRRDSRALKALSVLGTLYLPATFSATLFSSSLIQLQSTRASMVDSHYALASQFWLYIALTAPLMVLTVGYMMWVARR
ncbi:MAG: hypothetical protein Q9221_002096 [Calogaya cf. arnoldii]